MLEYTTGSGVQISNAHILERGIRNGREEDGVQEGAAEEVVDVGEEKRRGACEEIEKQGRKGRDDRSSRSPVHQPPNFVQMLGEGVFNPLKLFYFWQFIKFLLTRDKLEMKLAPI